MNLEYSEKVKIETVCISWLILNLFIKNAYA